MDIVSFSPRRTRMQISVDLTPKSLRARLLVQSLKFAKGNLNKKFSNRVWQFAQDVEEKFRGAG